MTLEWEQKLAAIQAFAGDAHLIMRQPEDWYVHAGMSIGGNGMLEGQYGNGATPAAAVDAHWDIYTSLPARRYAVNRSNKRAIWNGFMWREITDAEADAMREDAR